MSEADEQALYAEKFWTSADGLKLSYRDYPGPDLSEGAPIVCLPGLTRNARDFEDLAEHLSADRRVISFEMRGRGKSDYAPDPKTYAVPQYVEDLTGFLDDADIARAVFVGTSLGGLVTMMLASRDPDRVAGAVLNDIGPVVERAGLMRISGFVGQGRNYPTWMHAARALQESQGSLFPDWTIQDWLRAAKRVMVLGSGGRISFDYDMRIADAFGEDAEAGISEAAVPPPAALWAALAALAGRPVLVVRGEASDILSATTAQAMADRLPDLELVTIPRTGHAPTLDEDVSRAAIARLLERVR